MIRGASKKIPENVFERVHHLIRAWAPMVWNSLLELLLLFRIELRIHFKFQLIPEFEFNLSYQTGCRIAVEFECKEVELKGIEIHNSDSNYKSKVCQDKLLPRRLFKCC